MLKLLCYKIGVIMLKGDYWRVTVNIDYRDNDEIRFDVWRQVDIKFDVKCGITFQLLKVINRVIKANWETILFPPPIIPMMEDKEIGADSKKIIDDLVDDLTQNRTEVEGFKVVGDATTL